MGRGVLILMLKYFKLTTHAHKIHVKMAELVKSMETLTSVTVKMVILEQIVKHVSYK